MAILDIFKKKEREKEKKVKPKKEIKRVEKIEKREEAKEEKAKKEVVAEKKPQRVKEKKSDLAWQVLRAPQITEKATNLAQKNQYTFRVGKNSNKIEIKKAVKDLYNVDVLSVKIINVRPKKRRLARIRGWRAGYKKAVVRIKEGQKIEVVPR